MDIIQECKLCGPVAIILSGPWSNGASVPSSTQFRASTILLLLLAWNCITTHWSGLWPHRPCQVPWNRSADTLRSYTDCYEFWGFLYRRNWRFCSIPPKHCEVGPSHWLSFQEAASASNKPRGKTLKAAQEEQLHLSRSLGPFSHICMLIELLGPDTDILTQGWPSSTYRRGT